MLNRLLSVFRRAPPAASIVQIASAFAAIDMHWSAPTTMPVPDWEKIALAEHPEWTPSTRDTWWTAAAGNWLQALAARFGAHYRLHESADFLLLSALDDRRVELLGQYGQSVLRWIRGNLAEVAIERGGGKHVLIVFASTEEYYEYIGHYYPSDGEFAMSSGMFVSAGYGHFVMADGEMEQMQPTIAHELTHCLLSHLPIPAWLNEGMATNTEAALFPQLSDPALALYHPREMAAKHAAFWNAETIQTFWSGKSFLRPDEGNLLSYDLAKRITARAAQDDTAFRAFVLDAHADDGGLGAQAHLGYPLEHLIAAMLGEGDWAPNPQRWQHGVERGQFGFNQRRFVPTL